MHITDLSKVKHHGDVWYHPVEEFLKISQSYEKKSFMIEANFRRLWAFYIIWVC
jgi:hypothetical protein